MHSGSFSSIDEQQRVDFIRDAVDVLRGMKPVEADIYIKKLAEETGVSEGAIRFEYSGNNSQEKVPPGGEHHFRDDDRAAETAVEMPAAEKNLLKLMITDPVYIDLPEDVRDIVFRSEQGKSIYENILQICDGRHILDINALKDRLDEECAVCLAEIEAEIISPGTERSVFDECIAQIRKKELKKQEEEILVRLSMADEEENHEEIIRLTQQLIEIQKKIKK